MNVLSIVELEWCGPQRALAERKQTVRVAQLARDSRVRVVLPVRDDRPRRPTDHPDLA
jgi:hypothetical protein